MALLGHLTPKLAGREQPAYPGKYTGPGIQPQSRYRLVVPARPGTQVTALHMHPDFVTPVQVDAKRYDGAWIIDIRTTWMPPTEGRHPWRSGTN